MRFAANLQTEGEEQGGGGDETRKPGRRRLDGLPYWEVGSSDDELDLESSGVWKTWEVEEPVTIAVFPVRSKRLLVVHVDTVDAAAHDDAAAAHVAAKAATPELRERLGRRRGLTRLETASPPLATACPPGRLCWPSDSVSLRLDTWNHLPTRAGRPLEMCCE